MKRKFYALSGVFLIALVIAGLWVTKAVSFMDTPQTMDSAAVTSQPTGMSMQQMVGESSAIVLGTCTGTRSQWIERRLVTLATVKVAETLKGNPSPGTEMTVALPGGIDAKGKFKLAMTYAGAPTMRPGEEVALFLVPDQDYVANGYAVTSYADGKFSVVKANDGEQMVTRDMTSEPVQKGAGMMRGNSHAVPLSDFKKLVETYLNK